MTVQCGQNQTFNDVLVDTGSAILWVGAESPYVPGSNAREYVLHYTFTSKILKLYSINATFSVGYGIGGVQGTAYRDTVVIGQATAVGQIIGAANKTSGFNLVTPIDGMSTSLWSLCQINMNLTFFRSWFGTIS